MNSFYKWLSGLIIPHLDSESIIFDPCVGYGELLEQFYEKESFVTIGNDLIETECEKDISLLGNFLIWDKPDFVPDLVIMDPPFKGPKRCYYEYFIDKVFSLWKDVPFLVFVPYNFRTRQRYLKSGKYKNYISREITTIITPPADLFQQEIIIYNFPQLKSHYYVPIEVLEDILNERSLNV